MNSFSQSCKLPLISKKDLVFSREYESRWYYPNLLEYMCRVKRSPRQIEDNRGRGAGAGMPRAGASRISAPRTPLRRAPAVDPQFHARAM